MSIAVELLFAIQLVPERFPLDVRHHVEEERVRLARIEERQDMRMSQVRRRLDLGQETLGTDDRSQLGLQDLEGDFALVLDVVGQVHRGHAALA